MAGHSLELHQDEGGWDYGVCACGWQTSPVPGTDIVADAYGDHRAAQAVIVAANAIKTADLVQAKDK